MKINSLQTSQNSFSKTITNEYQSSIDIENCSYKSTYDNKELKKYSTTSHNITLFDNVLLTKYYDKIKESCTLRMLSKEEMIKYKYRPEALSADIYNTTDMWYLILKINSCEDYSEFHDLDVILLPDISKINECLVNEEFILKKGSV